MALRLIESLANSIKVWQESKFPDASEEHCRLYMSHTYIFCSNGSMSSTIYMGLLLSMFGSQAKMTDPGAKYNNEIYNFVSRSISSEISPQPPQKSSAKLWLQTMLDAVRDAPSSCLKCLTKTLKLIRSRSNVTDMHGTGKIKTKRAIPCFSIKDLAN